MPILNYTTSVAASRTVSQMQEALAKAGATTIAARYDEGREIGLSFTLMTVYGWRDFTLPVDTDAVWKVIGRQRGIPPRLRNREQAERVAWRIAKDWLEAQLAIVESQMVSFDQVMLPYMHVDETRTLYQAYEQKQTTLELMTGPTEE